MSNQSDKQLQPRRRTIRSFVRRTGRMTAGQERALNELWPRFGLEYTPLPIDMPELFGRDAPLVLEIGFGNGESLVQLAADAPQFDFIGIEVHRPGAGHCMLHAETAELQNLRLVCHDALDVLRHQIARDSLARINLYFPDPWPKARHHKRRILQHSFLELAASRLTVDGCLHIATDWANYAEHIDELLAGQSWFRVLERREHAGNCALERPSTKFEKRGLGKGHQIYDWKLQRLS